MLNSSSNVNQNLIKTISSSLVRKYGAVPAGTYWKPLEDRSSIQAENHSDNFRPVPAGKHRKLA
jgi:hypothetical protein